MFRIANKPVTRAKNNLQQTLRHFAYLSQNSTLLTLARLVFWNEFILQKVPDSKPSEAKNTSDIVSKDSLPAVRFHRCRSMLFSPDRGVFSQDNHHTVYRRDMGICVNFKKCF